MRESYGGSSVYSSDLEHMIYESTNANGMALLV
jgi:hypothetical protein